MTHETEESRESRLVWEVILLWSSMKVTGSLWCTVKVRCVGISCRGTLTKQRYLMYLQNLLLEEEEKLVWCHKTFTDYKFKLYNIISQDKCQNMCRRMGVERKLDSVLRTGLGKEGMVRESHGWRDGVMCLDRCSNMPNVSTHRERGLCVGTYWPSLKISQLKHFGRSWQLFWEMPNGAGRMPAETHTHTHVKKLVLSFRLPLTVNTQIPRISTNIDSQMQAVWSQRQYLRVLFSAHEQTGPAPLPKLHKLATHTCANTHTVETTADEGSYVGVYRRR